MLKSFWTDQSGQAVTEYILLVAAIVAFCIGIIRSLRGIFDQGLLVLGGALERDLRTGRTPPNAWSN